MEINTQIPVIGEIVNPTITAGIPPIYGPKYGIISVIKCVVASC